MDASADLRSVAGRLAHLRRRLGLTRAGLERELRARGAPRASVMTIRRNESGERSPTAAEVLAMSALAGVPPGWILDGRRGSGRAMEPAERRRILGHLEAELLRDQDLGRPTADAALQRVQTRLEGMRARGELSDDAWTFWLGVRAGMDLAAEPGRGGSVTR